jgi:hypothetical protein
LDLSDVWNYLGSEVKRAIKTVTANQDHIRTRNLLAALAVVSKETNDDELLLSILKESSIKFHSPQSLSEEVDPVPESIDLTPAVKETLDFFRMHKIRSVSVNDFARRLLQIGTGSTVRSLEDEGRLDTAIQRLEANL